MRATQTHGFCGFCREMSPYKATHCSLCRERLVWAFLNDAENHQSQHNRFDEFLTSLLKNWGLLSKQHIIKCRFCEGRIAQDENICPHCKNWLVEANVTTVEGRYLRYAVNDLLDPTAPEIQRLVALYQAQRQEREKNQNT